MPEEFKNASLLLKEEILNLLNTKLTGLSEDEAKKRLSLFGLNKITSKRQISALKIFLDQFKSSLVLILIASAILILFIYFFGEKETSDLIEAGLILGITLMISILGFIQEYKAEKAVEALRKMLSFKAKVIRDGKERQISVEELVPGDIVILEEGEKVPADIRLIQNFNFATNESSLTGESTPVSKSLEPLLETKQISDQKNMAFSSTVVTRGKAIGVVIKTGDQTEIGKIAKDVAEVKDDPTPIQKRLDEISKALSLVILAICGLVFIFIVFFANEFITQPLLQRIIHSFIASVALAVAAIPEGLPAVVTISLALGTQRMLKKNALVRKLNSVETLGSTDIICSDKTGTLTKGEMTVRQIFYNSQIIEVTGSGYETSGQFFLNSAPINPSTLKLLLQIGLDCNNSLFDAQGNLIGDPTELALLISAKKATLNQRSTRLFEIPFSSERKMMSIVVQVNNEYLLFSKGAPEVLLNKCSKIIKDSTEISFDQLDKLEILDQTQKMSLRALRTLGFAYRKIPQEKYQELVKSPEQLLETDLTFVGLQGMIDPPRLEVKPLIEQCQTSGIRVIMITGDHIETAKAIAKEIGILGQALSGEQLDRLSDEQFKEEINRTNIYARVNPGFKMRIIDVLKKQGHIVAMTGDGVNDAPALKKADIGIAMGITGTDVSKEASDVVLMDDKFSTIVYAIEEGRGIFQNIKKFVNYLLSCNIGEVILVFLSVLIFQKLPLSATMLLWINVVTDGLPAVALGMDPPQKDILNASPKSFQSQIISKKLWIEMFIFGILLAIAVLGIYALNLPRGLAYAQGAAFCAIVIFEMAQLFIIRSRYKTKLFSNKWLFGAVITTIILQLVITYTPFIANLFEIEGISSFDWGYILVASLVLALSFKAVQKFLDSIFKPPALDNGIIVATS